MSLIAHELRASYAFVERNFFLTRRYWGWEVAFLVYSVAGALSISLIGASVGDSRLLLSLIIGATFWNYLAVVFDWISQTIAIERWEGTLEYTMMAPIRRVTHLLGSVLYALVYGLIHTSVVLFVLTLFYPFLIFEIFDSMMALIPATPAANMIDKVNDVAVYVDKAPPVRDPQSGALMVDGAVVDRANNTPDSASCVSTSQPRRRPKARLNSGTCSASTKGAQMNFSV